MKGNTNSQRGKMNGIWKIVGLALLLASCGTFQPQLELGTQAFAAGEVHSLQVTTPGLTDRYARHAGGLGFTEVVTAQSSDTLKQDATWKVVAGLADASCYSLESLNFPGEYLRHASSRVRKDKSDGSSLFKQDATWCARNGLSGTGTSFESKNFPGRYLRHYKSALWLAQKGGGLESDAADRFEQDTTWSVVPAWSAGGASGVPGSPKPVTKRVSAQVFAHVMPWFESKAFSGYWGQHWTMANQNPDIVDSSGRRQIASHYYPLTGPYASADPDITEYQLLLMKLSGIDGVLIDWPGTTNLYDYPRNKSNSEAMIAQLSKVGLKFSVIYEDQNINIAAQQGVVTDKIGQAKTDMAYLQNNYFSQGTYQKVNGRPLLGVFGPQTFQSPGEWQQIFSGLSTKPCFVTLWYEHQEAAGSSDCTGEYSWVYQDSARTHLQHLRDFYSGRPNYGVKMGSAYPGFRDFYAQGGWGSNNFYIAANGTTTFSETLDLALSSGLPYLQLATWNDYGEGTMIEPTREFGYGLLTTLQQKLGVPYGQSELELVTKLYAQRRQYRGNAPEQARLDRAAAFLAALQIDQARTTLAATP